MERLDVPDRQLDALLERLDRIAEQLERIYGAWWDRVVPADAKDAVRRSVARYTAALRGELPL